VEIGRAALNLGREGQLLEESAEQFLSVVKEVKELYIESEKEYKVEQERQQLRQRLSSQLD